MELVFLLNLKNQFWGTLRYFKVIQYKKVIYLLIKKDGKNY